MTAESWCAATLLPDEAATAALGRRLAPLLRAGDVVALRGDLGMGKSTLARGLIQALMQAAITVPSPTFTLVQHYNAPDKRLIAHYDWYRLRRAEDVLELGLEDDLAMAVTLVEWPERAPQCLPARRLAIALSQAPGDGRNAEFTGSAAWKDRLQNLFPA